MGGSSGIGGEHSWAVEVKEVMEAVVTYGLPASMRLQDLIGYDRLAIGAAALGMDLRVLDDMSATELGVLKAQANLRTLWKQCTGGGDEQRKEEVLGGDQATLTVKLSIPAPMATGIVEVGINSLGTVGGGDLGAHPMHCSTRDTNVGTEFHELQVLDDMSVRYSCGPTSASLAEIAIVKDENIDKKRVAAMENLSVLKPSTVVLSGVEKVGAEGAVSAYIAGKKMVVYVPEPNDKKVSACGAKLGRWGRRRRRHRRRCQAYINPRCRRMRRLRHRPRHLAVVAWGAKLGGCCGSQRCW